MKMNQVWIACACAALLSTPLAQAEIKTVVEHIGNDDAKPGFKFKNISAPSKTDAATKAKFTIVDGEQDGNGGSLDTLHDGATPTDEDQPEANFFFRQGADGGRIQIDLGNVIDVKQINTYSWHRDTRGPQVYKLYAADGKAANFAASPKRGTDPEKVGWKLLANVDARPKAGKAGGQYGVSTSDTGGSLGRYRYLLFDISKTEAVDPFGNTFYSEIDVIDKNAPPTVEVAGAAVEDTADDYATEGGREKFSILYADAPDLKDWTRNILAPTVAKWYPMIARMLPSPGYEAARKFTIEFTNRYHGVAATGGTHIVCDPAWYRNNVAPKGQGPGSVVHELVHVVQQYKGARGARIPGWLVEGIPDYIRWYLYEPQTHGAEITARGLAQARYDGSYRISANFLSWATNKYDKDLVPKLNLALRQGSYGDEQWTKLTNHGLEELNEEWRQALADDLGVALPAAAAADPTVNTLSAIEKAAGWVLLFDGKDFNGWHNFKDQGVHPGWQVKDGTLACVDPHQAGDIVTTEKFGWFELQLDYNISEAGNSGIMYHVTDDGGAVWATGPEFQLEDNVKAADPVRCGWLYALYQPPIDPATGKALDATKPAGQWNHVRLLISPEKCVHEINGVKYFEYVLGSEDFNRRVARSKFASMPGFAKATSGYIALQGDHGSVIFRNIKIRPIQP